MWTWRLIEQDRTTVATGEATYDSCEAVETVVSSVRDAATTASVFDIEDAVFLLSRDDGAWRRRLFDEDHTVLACSPAAEDTRDDAREAVRRVSSLPPDPTVLDFEGAAFEVYEWDA